MKKRKSKFYWIWILPITEKLVFCEDLKTLDFGLGSKQFDFLRNRVVFQITIKSSIDNGKFFINWAQGRASWKTRRGCQTGWRREDKAGKSLLWATTARLLLVAIKYRLRRMQIKLFMDNLLVPFKIQVKEIDSEKIEIHI